MRVLVYVCLAGCLFAGTHTTEFRGRVIDGGVASYDGLVVEVTNLQDRSIREHVDVASDGSFAFGAIPDGDYQVRILTLYGDEVTNTVASTGPVSMPIEIRLPQAKVHKPISGTVSVGQLSHPLSRQVRKLLASGQRLIDDQHYGDAAARFREAAKDDPNCAQAHANLGLALAKMEDWNGAAEEYRSAVSLDPRNTLLHTNLSAVLASGLRFDEAESEALAALKLDPRNGRAHFVMAGVLIRKHANVPEVVAHLVAAQDAMPSARVALEKICAANHVQGCP